MKMQMLKRLPAIAPAVAIVATLLAINVSTVAAQKPPKHAAPEAATHGKSHRELTAARVQLLEQLSAETPAQVRKQPIIVPFTSQDDAKLNAPVNSGNAVPLRVGLVKTIEPGIAIEDGQGFEQGVMEETADGGFVWAVAITSPGAKAIRLQLTNVSLPDQARLYFYDPEGQAFGPYTGNGRNGNGEFWTHSVPATTGVLQLRYEGAASDNDRRTISFTVTGLGHVRSRTPLPDPQSHNDWPCRETTQSCFIDANCTSGTPADIAKDAVAKMEWIDDGYIFSCTGGLLADTDASTQVPYFLTANHCLAADNPNLETFFFYWTESCNGACPDALVTGGTPPTPHTIGVTVQATGLDADFTLLTLDEDPPADATYLGWNNAPLAYTNGAELYRISNPNFGPQVYSAHQVNTGRPECPGWDRGHRIYSTLLAGGTMGGSSGAPVLNAAGEVVGQLSGCCGFNCDNDCDVASNATVDGALASYWEQVEPFLDPNVSCNNDGACGLDEDCNSCPGDCGGGPGAGYCCNGDLIQPDCGDTRCSEAGSFCDPGGLCGTDPNCPAGQIVLDQASVASKCAGAAADSVTLLDVTVGTQANRILVVTAGGEENDADCDLAHPDASATYGGLPLQTAVTSVSDLNEWRTCSAIFYMLAPPSGTADVVITFPRTTSSTINNRQVGAFVLHGAAQQAPESVAFDGSDNSANPLFTNIAVHTQKAWVVDGIMRGNTGTFSATEFGQSEVWQRSCSSSSMASSILEASSTGVYTFGWDHNVPNRFAHVLASFAPALGPGGSTTTTLTSATSTTTLAPPTTLPVTTTTSTTTTSTTTTSTTSTTTTLPGARVMLDTASVASRCAGVSRDTETLADVTVGTQNNRILVVTAGAEENDADCDFAHPDAVATYGGVPLQKAATAVSDLNSWRTCSAVFYMLAPPSGVADVVIQFPQDTTSAINNRQVGAFVLYGAAQQAPNATATNGADNKANPVSSDILVSAQNAMVVDALVRGNTGTFTTTGAGQVERWQRSCRSSSMATSTLEAGSAGIYSLGWSHSNPGRFAHALAAFTPASDSGTTTTTLAPTTTTTTLAPTTTVPVTTTTTTTSTSTTTTSTTLPGGHITLDAASLASRCAGASRDSETLADVTVGTQTDRILIVTAGAEENDADCDFAHPDTVATYGGVPLVKAVTAVSDLNSWRTCSAVFYMLAPPTGTADVVVSFAQDTTSAINNRHVGAFVIFGAAQQAPESSASRGADNKSNPILSDIAVSTPKAWVVDALVRGNTGSYTPTETGQVEAWQRSCSSSSMATSVLESTSPGSYSLGWDHSNPARFAHALAAFAAAAP
jgi:hypothetical protein